MHANFSSVMLRFQVLDAAKGTLLFDYIAQWPTDVAGGSVAALVQSMRQLAREVGGREVTRFSLSADGSIAMPPGITGIEGLLSINGLIVGVVFRFVRAVEDTSAALAAEQCVLQATAAAAAFATPILQAHMLAPTHASKKPEPIVQPGHFLPGLQDVIMPVLQRFTFQTVGTT